MDGRDCSWLEAFSRVYGEDVASGDCGYGSLDWKSVHSTDRKATLEMNSIGIPEYFFGISWWF